MDISVPGVPTERLREMGMVRQKGGVGYYPKSGTPFVHLDVGSVRAWPRMNTMQLARLFPSGQTLHRPSDGPPLDGYNIALARLGRDGKRNEPLLAFADNTSSRNVLKEEDEPVTVAALAPQIKPEAPKVLMPAAAIPVPTPRPDGIMQMASLVPLPQMRPSDLAPAVFTVPRLELAALRFDSHTTAGFSKASSAERAVSLKAPQMKLASAYLSEPVAPQKAAVPRKWIKMSLADGNVKMAANNR